MDSFRYDYAVIGGDLRQVYLLAELLRTGSRICQYALCRPPEQVCPHTDEAFAAPSCEEACRNAACIVCPIPLSKDGIFLNQNRSRKNIPIQQLLLHLSPGQLFLAGCIPKDFAVSARKKNIRCVDFMKDTTLSHFNSLATAEGVICEAIRLSPLNLHHSRCAVLGYGTCGRTMTDYLKRMHCYVSVAAAPEAELAQAALIADQAVCLEEFFRQIGEFDFIFNTIPSVILTRERLCRTKPAAAILDIASYPGGVDYDAAKELSVNAVFCPGLPGKYAPLSSARAILSCIKRAEAQP